MNIKSTLGKRIVLDKEKRIYLNLAVIGVIAIFAFFLIFKPAIEGYAVGGREYRYTEKINLTVNGSQEYLWYPDNPGELSSIKITGNLSGSAKVYLEYEGKKYLIFDKYKESVDRITGLAIIEANQTAEINETINLTLNETQINETFGNGTFPNGLETNVSKTIINQSLNETINQTEEIVINQTEELTNETVQINQSIINETPINESI